MLDHVIQHLVRTVEGVWLCGFMAKVNANDITFLKLLALRDGLMLAWQKEFLNVYYECTDAIALVLPSCALDLMF